MAERRWKVLKKITSVLVGILLIPSTLNAEFFDDFEDGDYTNNPTWTVTNNVGEATVVADPLRQNNMVLRSYGTAGSQQVVETELENSIPGLGFNMSVEFLSSTDWYHPYFRIVSDSYSLKLELLRAYASQDIRFRVSETGASTHDAFPNFSSPIDNWWRLNLWHDVDTGYVNAEIRLADNNFLLAEQSFLPTSQMATASDINSVWIEVGEPDWQYVDNLTITPEPCSLLLIGLGGLVVLKRRK